MKLKQNNFISYFKNIGISMLVIKSIDDKFIDFINFMDFDLIITDYYHGYHGNKIMFEEDDLLNELEKLKNKKVIITVPLNEWRLRDDTYETFTRIKRLTNFIEKIMGISYKNNLSIIIMNILYNSPNNVKILHGGNRIGYMMNYIVSYSDDIFTIDKNRYGVNYSVDINDMKFLFLKELRMKKLKRITEKK